MGVPKFYRWLSERYACLSQVVKDYQIPEFDNLYLDMNGIIHPCSHPNDDDPHFRITEEQIFSNIFHYIEVLFRIIKPQKVFFMAVDGVAPRAKMNQQRSRRFRSAREAEKNIKKALEKGEVLPTEERFDSNCITPGTEFMVRLHEQLKYFVNKKITTDPGWQGLKIYLSGHETPGEGEHKIMDFIRYERSQPGYDSNTRHCLYGLDADLIMLGLTSHDPYFSLLREEVKFGKKEKRTSNPENITFHLLHLSLLREYIDWEFESLKEKISFGYDLEKIIDDWILMGFLVGNDFIPNLPNLHINHDALPYLWKVYKDIMPSLDGYLHEGGTLSLQRFEHYLTALAKFDLETFEDKYVDLKWLESKKAQSDERESSEMSDVDGSVQSTSSELSSMSLNSGKKEGEKNGGLSESTSSQLSNTSGNSGKKQGGKNGGLGESTSNQLSNTSVNSGKKKGGKLLEYLEEKGMLDDEEDDGDFSEEHEKYKLRYYREKFKLEEDDSCEKLVKELCFKYVEAIQWILHYYFNGISSWGWFYPFHYAPYVSDIKDFQDHPLSFNIGKAFLPFEQLLAVLPAASKKLLPEPFQSLMIMEHSPIIHYYPPEFETDLNGKRQDWEAVVLIPFIDEESLLSAMEPLYPRLKKSEKDRNRHTLCLLYTHDPEKSEHYPSSLPGIFPDLESCRVSCETVPIDKYRLARDKIVKGLLPDVKLDVYFPGFPTLKHVSHSGELKKVGVKVFQMHSRGESMVLKIDETDELDVKEVSESLLGRPCFVGWPHLVEAFVTTVSDGSKKYLIDKTSPENVVEVSLTDSDASVWKKQVSCEKQSYLEKKAVDIGMTHILIEACQIQGKTYVCGTKGDVSLETKWSDWAVAYPLQVTVKNINMCDETDAGAQCTTVSDLFPVGTECFMMAIPHYGSSGKVIEVNSKTNRVRVQLTVVPEPDLVSLILDKDDYAENYIPAHIMAKRLGLTSLALAQITGKVLLATGDKENSSKVDIGLNLKFSKKDKEVLGYARRNGGSWSYSPKTERTISMYQEKFPQVFDVLSNNSTDVRKVSDVFPDNEKTKVLAEVEQWLKSLPSHNQKPVSCGSSTLDEPIVKQVEEAVEKLKEEKPNRKNVKVRVKPTVLYRPMKQLGQVPPDPEAKFELFDRVVNVRTLGVAPYALKGTIVGIHQGKSENDPVSYEVLFDEPFMGGQSLRGSFENKLCVMPEWSLLNLSHGTRLECEKKGLPSPLVQAQQKRQQTRPSARHNKGVPAEYKPSNRGGAYHKDFYSQPFPASADRRITSPNGRSPNSRERYSSPRHCFASPDFNFPGQRPHFSPRWDTPRSHSGYRPLNTQASPRDSSDFYTSRHQSPDSRQAMNTSEQLSAQESERVIRQLLHLDVLPAGSNSPHATFNAPVNAFQMPPMSPTSPVSPSNSSGLLVLACLQNRWPQPTFSHHRVGQHFITTVCVAGKMFQGSPCVTVEEACENAAQAALMTFFPHFFSRQNNGMISPFAFPPSPNIPHFSPTYHSNTSPRHDSSKKNEGTFKSSPGFQDKTSESNKPSPRAKEDKNKTKIDSSNKQNFFIPLQVSLKKNEVVNSSPAKTSEDRDTVEAGKSETQEPAKIQANQEPIKTQEIQEPAKNQEIQESAKTQEIQEPAKTQANQEPIKTQASQEPIKTQEIQEPAKNQEIQESAKTQEIQEPAKTQANQEPIKTQASQEPIKTQEIQDPTNTQETQKPTKTQASQVPTKIQTKEATKTQTKEATKTQTTKDPTKSQEIQEPTKTQEIQEPTNTHAAAKPEEKDNSTTKPNDDRTSKTTTLKVDRTSIKNNAETSTRTKAKPVLLAPSFFTKK